MNNKELLNNYNIKNKYSKPKIGIKTLHIAFGVPGSGKTTLFEILSKQNKNIKNITRFEADEYPGLYTLEEKNININGIILKKKFLVFNFKKLGEAHKWCKDNVENAMKKNTENIYQSNTNLSVCDMFDYLTLAYKYDYIIKIHIPKQNKLLKYPTNITFNEQVIIAKQHRSKINYNENNEIIEKSIPEVALNKMIQDFKINGAKLRELEIYLKKDGREYDPESWIKNILVNFKCPFISNNTKAAWLNVKIL